jgi:hypothetical protein
VTERLGVIADRLRAVAAELRDPDTDDERAQALAAEAAELAAEAGAEAERGLREASADE